MQQKLFCDNARWMQEYAWLLAPQPKLNITKFRIDSMKRGVFKAKINCTPSLKIKIDCTPSLKNQN